MSDKLPPGWAWTTLGGVGRYLNGRGFKKSEWGQVGRPIIRIQNLTRSSNHFNYFDGHADPRHVVHPGDLLVSWAATLGVFVWRGQEAVLNQHIFKVESLIHQTFHRWLLEHVLGDLHAQAHGSGMIHITKSKFEATRIPIPPRVEQKRIVDAIGEHFSRLDAAERGLAGAKRKLDSLQRSAVAHLFDRADWPWTTLGEIAELKGGVTKDSKRQNDPSYAEVPYLRVANVQRGSLDLSEVTRIRVSPAKAAQLALRPGDVLFNEGGDRDKLGRGWVWEGQIENCIHQNHVFRARLSNGDFDPYFISMHGNTWGQRWFETHGKQTTNLASLNLTTLKSFPVPAPPLAEQQEIVAELQSIGRYEDRLSAEIVRAENRSAALMNSLLAAAFSGRLVPQDPDDEPASLLLERIDASRPAKPERRRTRT